MIKPEDVIQFASAITKFKNHLESQVRTYEYLHKTMSGNITNKIKYDTYLETLESFNLIMGEIE